MKSPAKLLATLVLPLVAWATSVQDANVAEAKPVAAKQTTDKHHDSKSVKTKPTTRKIDFKSPLSLGTLYVYEDDEDPKWQGHRLSSGRFSGAAQGIVNIEVPPNYKVGFKPNSRLYENPQLMDGISNQFEGLLLEASSVDEEDDPRFTKLFPHLGRFTKLQELYIDRSDVSDQQIGELPMLNSLERFCAFSDMLVKGSCLQRLSKYPNLKQMNFCLSGFDPKNLAILKDMKRLEALNLSQNRLTGGLNKLTACPSLKLLDISSTGVNDNDLKSLQKFANLEHLDVDHCPITDAGLMSLAELKHLKWLDVQGTGVTAGGVISFLKKAHLERLLLTNRQFSNADVQKISALCTGTFFGTEDRKRAPTKEEQRLFAPITRHAGF